MLKGFLTIATSHTLYGKFAYNLALSIKASDPKQKVCIITDDIALNHLNEGQKMIFDKIIKVSDEQLFRNEKRIPLLTKFYLYDLSPYEKETIFLDSDIIFSTLCNYNELWKSYSKVNWTMANRGFNDPNKGISEWVDVNKLLESYPDVTQWIDLSSEWIYWKQNEESKKIFDLALEYYDENKLLTRFFAGDKPDEPFFNLALNKLKEKPHKIPYQPTYWQPAIRKILSSLEIKKQYYAFSAGGNFLPPTQQRIYDEFAKNAAYKMNTQEFKVPHKRTQLKDRTYI